MLLNYWNLVFTSWKISKRWRAVKACHIFKLFKHTSYLFSAQDILGSSLILETSHFCRLRTICSLLTYTLKTWKSFLKSTFLWGFSIIYSLYLQRKNGLKIVHNEKKTKHQECVRNSDMPSQLLQKEERRMRNSLNSDF